MGGFLRGGITNSSLLIIKVNSHFSMKPKFVTPNESCDLITPFEQTVHSAKALFWAFRRQQAMTPGFKARSTPSSHKSSTVFCYRPALIFTTGDHFHGGSNHLSHRAKPRTAKHFGFKYISYLVLTGYVCSSSGSSSSFDSFAFCLVFKSFLKTCLGKILGKFKSKPFPGNGASYAGYTDRD